MALSNKPMTYGCDEYATSDLSRDTGGKEYLLEARTMALITGVIGELAQLRKD